ncbi:MAG: patatin-like phospholipase family protein [Candidatus Kerfeldbacteria bacterium]
MSEKAVLYLGGGGMSGVFGGGVVTGLEQANIYNKLKSVYSCSAGTLNGAFFLTHQTKYGASIFWEELAHGFIRRRNIPIGAIQRLWHGYVAPIKHDSMLNAMDPGKVIDVVKNKKKLNIAFLKNQPITLFVKLLNTQNMKIEYHDARDEDNIFSLLKSGISAIPYYYPSPDNGHYVDAAIKEPLGLDYILEQNPNSKIIAVFNLTIHRHFGHQLKNFIEGVVSNPMYPGTFSECFMQRENSVRKSLALAMKEERIMIVHPSKDNLVQSWILDENKLKKLYNEGMQTAQSIMEFLD